MAKTKTAGAASAEEKEGRALVDIPALGLVSGEYATLPGEVADAYAAVGAFDTDAVKQ